MLLQQNLVNCGVYLPALAKQAVSGALADAGLKRVISSIICGKYALRYVGRSGTFGAFFAEELGLSVPAFKIEGACASGGLALHNAVNSVLSGQYETVVVLGVEKMTDHKPEDVATALMGAGSESERLAGATFPGLYALLCQVHMATYGTTVKQLAAVAVKNHYHASLNPNAQFHNILTVEQVLKSSCVADPLKLLDCSPISDGAAALVITSAKKGIRIAASVVATDSLGLAQRKSLLTLDATHAAATRAYSLAGVEPTDIDVAEVHDCFTIAEILAMEDLGLYEKGKAAEAIARGETMLGKSKKLVVNPSGGLKGCGHPVGATGVKQVAELVEQLRGERIIDMGIDAKIGLAHNVGGSGATAVVHILTI